VSDNGVGGSTVGERVVEEGDTVRESAPDLPRRARRRSLRAALGYLLVVLCILFLVRSIDSHLLFAAFRDISWGDIVKLALLSFLLIFVSVLKWRAFLSRLGIVAPLGKLLRLYVVGYFVNLVMPSYVGGDVVRSLSIGREVDKTHALSATFLERYTGLVSMIAMALIAVIWSDAVTTQIRYAVFVLAVGCIGATVFLLLGCTSLIGTHLRLPGKIIAMARKMESALRWGVSDVRLLTKVFALSFLFHILTVINTAVCASAVGWHTAHWFDLTVVVPLILVVGALPLSPQGLGVQEGAFLFFLHSIGATSEQALAVGLVLRAKSYLLAGLGGVLWMKRGRSQ
jgi:uncharacterized protein (TIRG00374 family)